MDGPNRIDERCAPPPLERARHYQDLARRHPDEELFWLCRASYFGRMSVRP